ncbi:hypothetical protein ACUWCL_29345, partial [Klebsiella pneumoniae]|uniref:hypothetical protein n=1 Tax=Klebsiella pneumoniae TaxID=573 RepID=UPI004055560A
MTEARIQARGVTGDCMPVQGQQVLEVTLGGVRTEHEFLITEFFQGYDGILGMDFLRKVGAVIDVAGVETSEVAEALS